MSFTVECLAGVPIVKSSDLTQFTHPTDPDAYDARAQTLTACVNGFCNSQCVQYFDDGTRMHCQAKNPEVGVGGVKIAVIAALINVVYQIGPSPTDTPQ